MSPRAFRVAYDGRPFYGFQRQPDVPTVEGELCAALSALGVSDAPGDPPEGYAAAGRTDRGVSALAQTVAVPAPEWLSPRALNGELPADVRAWASADVPASFHATRDAAWRAYAYHLHAPDADLGRIRAVLDGLAGTHDFHNLAAVEDGDTTRTVLAADADRDGEFVVVRVRADGFLREMVRRVVTLVGGLATRGSGGGDGDGGGSGRAGSVASLPGIDPRVTLDRALSAERLTGPEGIAPAPPEPLVLTGVGYPGVTFDRDERAIESLRAVFGERRREAAARERVMGAIGEAGTAGDGEE